MSAEELENSMKKFTKFAKKLFSNDENNLASIENFLNVFGERIVMCPATIMQSNNWSRPGGLLDYSLEITTKMIAIRDAMEMDISNKSIGVVGLFHYIGMIGDQKEELLFPHDSDWHIKQGRLYKFNEKIQKMSIPHRSLFLLQEFGVKLTQDEWLAILLCNGQAKEENRFYLYNENDLAILLMQAKNWVERKTGRE